LTIKNVNLGDSAIVPVDYKMEGETGEGTVMRRDVEHIELPG
jgi:hypothetical protein